LLSLPNKIFVNMRRHRSTGQNGLTADMTVAKL
jgi:hypothetical protein